MRTAQAVALALFVSLSPVCTGHLVFAQPSAVDDALTKRARARFQEGVDAFDKGQYENARLSFMEAYALKKHPAVLMNLAQSCLRAGHPGEAARFFQQYLREATQAAPAQRAEAEKGLAEARAKAGRIEVTAPAGMEILSASGERLGTAPLPEPLDVEPGQVVLKGRNSDGTFETVTVSVHAGQRATARFGASAAIPVPVPVPVPSTTPAPPTTPEVKPPEPLKPEVKPEVPITPPPTEPERKKGLLSRPDNMTPVYIGLGVGVAGLASAITFAIIKGSAQSNADKGYEKITAAAKEQGLPVTGICNPAPSNFRAACNQVADNNSTVDTSATIANISVVVMAVGLGTAAGWYLFGPKGGAGPEAGKTALQRTQLAPLVGPQTGGLLLSHTF